MNWCLQWFVCCACFFSIFAASAFGQTCPSSAVSLSISGPVLCDQPFLATLTNSGPSTCPFSSGGALLCDSNHLNCQSCTNLAQGVNSISYRCTGLHLNGVQILTATFLIGNVITTVSSSSNLVNCASVPGSPVTVSPPLPPVPCDTSSVSLNVEPPLILGAPFTALLNTSLPQCPLSSGGALLCHLGTCSSCSVTQVDSASLLYNCNGPTTSLPQTLTGTYQLANTITTISVSNLVFQSSPTTPSTVPATPTVIIPPTPISPPPQGMPPTQPQTPVGPSPPPLGPFVPFSSVQPGVPPVIVTPAPPSQAPLIIPPSFGPAEPPVVPPPHPPSLLGCDTSSVSLYVYPPLYAGLPFRSTLNTTGSCTLSSGGSLICNPSGCVQCLSVQDTPSSLHYNCSGLPTVGIQDFTAVYLLGDVISRLTVKTLPFYAPP